MQTEISPRRASGATADMCSPTWHHLSCVCFECCQCEPSRQTTSTAQKSHDRRWKSCTRILVTPNVSSCAWFECCHYVSCSPTTSTYMMSTAERMVPKLGKWCKISFILECILFDGCHMPLCDVLSSPTLRALCTVQEAGPHQCNEPVQTVAKDRTACVGSVPHALNPATYWFLGWDTLILIASNILDPKTQVASNTREGFLQESGYFNEKVPIAYSVTTKQDNRRRAGFAPLSMYESIQWYFLLKLHKIFSGYFDTM